MDFERKYNELVEAARAVVEGNPGLCDMNKRLGRVRDLLPEKESDDEKIRKEIIEFLTDGIWIAKEISKVRETQKYAKWIAYLEKQKEQKEINLVKILKHYPKETELYSPLYGKLWLAAVDETNEIITCYKHPIEKDDVRAILEQEDTVSFYSNGTTGMPDFEVSKDCMLFLYNNEKQKEPHYTKRNALFDKCVENCDPEVMKNVSDEVDKMLQKEQKPAGTSNIDLDTKVNVWVGYTLNGNAQSYSRKDVQIMLDNCARYFYDYAVMCLDKPAEWSEEDEDYFMGVKAAVNDYFDEGYAEELCTWLKSLCPPTKQEWDEEDEKHLNWVIENFGQGGGLYDDLIYWLTQLPKRFRPQPH